MARVRRSSNAELAVEFVEEKSLRFSSASPLVSPRVFSGPHRIRSRAKWLRSSFMEASILPAFHPDHRSQTLAVIAGLEPLDEILSHLSSRDRQGRQSLASCSLANPSRRRPVDGLLVCPHSHRQHRVEESQEPSRSTHDCWDRRSPGCTRVWSALLSPRLELREFEPVVAYPGHKEPEIISSTTSASIRKISVLFRCSIRTPPGARSTSPSVGWSTGWGPHTT